jgi:tetratricopeptide (TPR) repeat protein
MAARASDLPTPHDSRSAQAHAASWLAPLVIVLAILGTYWTVCAFDFTNWDDQLNVTQNPHLNPPTAEGAAYFWLHPYGHVYIPVCYMIWWGLARLARLDAPDARGVWLNPYIFHSANLLVHMATCLAVYQLLRLLVGRRWPAAGGALLFALHPLQVEPVAWVTGMKDLSAGFFSMVALWQYVRFAQSYGDPSIAMAKPDRRGHSATHWHYALATAALIGALLAKPSAVTVPVLAAIIDWLLLRRPWRRIAVALAPWLAISAALAVVGAVAQPASEVVSLPFGMRPLVVGDSLAWYLAKLVLPVRLAALYPHSAAEVLASREIWIAWLLPAALAAAAWMLRRRAPWLAAAALIFAVAPLPVLGLAPFFYQRFSTVADRYAYVAMLGPSLAVAFALVSLFARRSRVLAIWMPAVCATFLILLAVLSASQARSWRDTGTLFSRVLQVDPSSDVAYCDLASEALATGRAAEAETLARRAYRLKPDRTNNGLTLAAALEAQGRHGEAIGYYRDVLRLDPNDVTALTGLVYELASSGKPDEAMALCRRALAADPTFPAAHRDMAMLLSQSHQDQQAVAEAAEAVRLDPMTAVNHLVYAKMLEAVGLKREAAEQSATARALDPGAAGINDAAPGKH